MRQFYSQLSATRLIACEQTPYLEDIVKSGRARGTRKETRRRATGERRENLQRSLINFHCHPGRQLFHSRLLDMRQFYSQLSATRLIACEQTPYLKDIVKSGRARGMRKETQSRATRGRRENLQRSLINFHFHPGNPETPQSVKTVTANLPQIRKVTFACQVQTAEGAQNLFIH